MTCFPHQRYFKSRRPQLPRAHGRYIHTQHLSYTTLSFSLTHSHMPTCKKARGSYMYGAIRPLVLILYGWLGNSRIEPSARQSATAVQSSHKDTPQRVIPERKELFIARVASGSHCTVLLTFRKPDEALFATDPGLINPDANIRVPPYRFGSTRTRHTYTCTVYTLEIA